MEKGSQKAAKLLLALGKENASNILKHLDEKYIEKLAVEIAEISVINAEEKETLLKEFRDTLRKAQMESTGGKDTAIAWLEKTLGKEKSQKYIDKIEKSKVHDYFKKLSDYPPEDLAHILSSELPQTAAIVLSQLKPPFAAAVIKEFDREYAAKVSYRIAKSTDVLPEVLYAVYQSLKKKLDSFSEDKFYEIDGENRLAEILKYVDSAKEETILESIRTEDDSMAERIRSQLFTFADIINLEQKEVRVLMERLSSYEIWAKALKGSGETLRRHILSSISINRSADIIDEMDRLDRIPISEVETARNTVLDTIHDLESENRIVLRKDGDSYVR